MTTSSPRQLSIAKAWRRRGSRGPQETALAADDELSPPLGRIPDPNVLLKFSGIRPPPESTSLHWIGVKTPLHGPLNCNRFRMTSRVSRSKWGMTQKSQCHARESGHPDLAARAGAWI